MTSIHCTNDLWSFFHLCGRHVEADWNPLQMEPPSCRIQFPMNQLAVQVGLHVCMFSHNALQWLTWRQVWWGASEYGTAHSTEGSPCKRQFRVAASWWWSYYEIQFMKWAKTGTFLLLALCCSRIHCGGCRCAQWDLRSVQKDGSMTSALHICTAQVWTGHSWLRLYIYTIFSVLV